MYPRLRTQENGSLSLSEFANTSGRNGQGPTSQTPYSGAAPLVRHHTYIQKLFNTKNLSPQCYNYTLSTLSNYSNNLRRVFKYKFGIILELRIMKELLQNVGQLFSNSVYKL